MRFFKEHARTISNVAVVLLVLVALWFKMTESGSGAVWNAGDGRILAASIAVLLVLYAVARRKTKGKGQH